MVRKLKKPLTVYYWVTAISTGVAGIVVIVVESFLCNQPTQAAGMYDLQSQEGIC
jgi:hypothetical protein